MYFTTEECKKLRHSSRILLLAAILAATLTGLFLASAFASVDADPVDGSDENVDSDTSDLISIEDGAFEDCRFVYGSDENADSDTSDLISIEDGAFEDCRTGAS